MPRVGKSTLAKMFLERDKISWMPLDIIRGALNSMVPELGIQEGEHWWLSHHEKFFPFLRKLIHRINESKLSYTLEGDSFLPGQAKELMEKYGVKACFLGVSKLSVETLTIFKGIDDGWLDELLPEKLAELPGWIVQKSYEYKLECEKYGIKYFDVSDNHEEAIENAYSFLKN